MNLILSQICRDIDGPKYGYLSGHCNHASLHQQCSIGCDSDHHLVPNTPIIRCTNNGWEPQSIPDGHCERPDLHQQCSIECDSEFVLTPYIPQIVCTEDGWTQSKLPIRTQSKLPICVSRQRKCSTITSPNNGYTEGKCKNARLDDQCIVKCYDEFKLRPNKSLICTENGWNLEDIPQCIKNCPKLVVPKNGDFEIPEQCKYGKPGDNCSVVCHKGYRLMGSKTITCKRNGNWSHILPVCEYTAITCSGLKEIDNSIRTGICESGISGKTCEYKCRENYKLDGHSIYTCLTNGQWDRQCCPKCIKNEVIKCPIISDIKNSKLSENCAIGEPDQICKIMCENGKIYDIKCLKNGKWDKDIPVCMSEQTTCQALNPPLNGYFEGQCVRGTTESQICQVICQNGYILVGNSQLKCESKGWSSAVPKCKPVECPSLTRPEPNGSLKGVCTPGIYKQNCQFICPNGFKLTPVIPNVICTSDGKWSNPDILNMKITCLAHSKATVSGSGSSGVCPPIIVKSIGGNIYGDCRLPQIGKSCAIKCNRGFRLIGNQTVVCGSNGRWIGQVPRCLRECPPIVIPSGSQTKGWCVPGIEGHICRVLCNQGYQLVGIGSILCRRGQWSVPPPTCISIG
ncbi:P-selectin-like [Oppia nitens]|uniref:P-selectin-like n=1 Tax=Oppia nitens TaxID=1686743 RepID=UPI0023D99BDA|nr:P-selectin-like [Oppia nitens]